METGLIIFECKSYTVLQTYYRTMGSFQQRLITTINNKTERRRTFYLVKRDKQLFWVKEYTKPAPCHDINYEFAETNRLCSMTRIESHEIRTVRMFCVENGRLLMEYCDGYTKLHETMLTLQQKTIVSQLIAKWLQEHPNVHNYDMCGNNILIKSDDNISIRLIDFEYSLKMSHQRWTQTRNKECWYNQAETITFLREKE